MADNGGHVAADASLTDALPEEILLHILSMLDDPTDLAAVMQTNKTLQRIAKDNSLWKVIYADTDPGSLEQKQEMFEWATNRETFWFDAYRTHPDILIPLGIAKDDESLVLAGLQQITRRSNRLLHAAKHLDHRKPDGEIDYRATITAVALRGWSNVLDELIHANIPLFKHTFDDEHDNLNTQAAEMLKHAKQALEKEPDFFAAAKTGDCDGVQAGLDAGIRINTPVVKHASETVLHIAAEHDQLAVLELLVKQPRIDLDARVTGWHGETALYLATNNGNIETTNALLAAGANPNIPNKSGNTPLLNIISQSRGNKEALITALLNSGAKPNCAAKNGDTPLHKTCLLGEKITTEILLSFNANPNATNKFGQTPLHKLLKREKDNVSITEKLIEHDADVNAQDNFGNTPLHKAAQFKSDAVAQMLLEAGANLETVNNFNQTAMHMAAKSGCLATVKFLHQQATSLGIDLMNARDAFNVRPIFYAAAYGKVEIVDYLLQQDCAVDNSVFTSNLPDNDDTYEYHRHKGMTILDAAALCWNRHYWDIQPYTNIIQSLLDDGRVTGQLSKALSFAKDFRIARQLLEAGAEPELYYEKQHFNEMHVAIIRGNEASVRELLVDCDIDGWSVNYEDAEYGFSKTRHPYDTAIECCKNEAFSNAYDVFTLIAESMTTKALQKKRDKLWQESVDSVEGQPYIEDFKPETPDDIETILEAAQPYSSSEIRSQHIRIVRSKLQLISIINKILPMQKTQHSETEIADPETDRASTSDSAPEASS